MITALSTRVNGIWREAIVRVVVHRYGAMAQNLSDIGKMIKQMAKAASYTLTEMFTKVNGSTIRPTVKVRMSIVTVPSLLVIGSKIVSMVSVLKSGPIMPNLRGILNRVKSMA